MDDRLSTQASDESASARELEPQPAPDETAFPLGEPSVLDYVKSRLAPWAKSQNSFPALSEAEVSEVEVSDVEVVPQPEAQPIRVPFRSMGALLLALAAQRTLEPSAGRTWQLAVALYALAAALAVWGFIAGEWRPPEFPASTARKDPLTVRLYPLGTGAVMLIGAFLLFGEGVFNAANVILWLGGTALLVYAFWLPGENPTPWYARLSRTLARSHWQVNISAWSVLVLLALAVSAFFRLYRLSDVPPEMVSDHAEKLFDVYDVLQGKLSIFFPRNTGREFFQMYLTAAVIKLFGTGYSFLSLKIGTVLGGLVTLPYIYLAGKEIANRRVGLIALAFAGIAYWPNLISRIALRFTLYPLFFAPVLFYVLRGLRTSNRNDFILAGLFLGLGLHGYSPYRFVPVLVVIAIALYLLHRQSKGQRSDALWWLGVTALISFAVFVPLMRYAVDNPEMFSYRTMTRLSSLERPLPGEPLQIFFSNLWRALTMFAWDNGEVWVISITHRPVLDWITSALFHLGALAVVLRYLRHRNWMDLFLLISIPVLMMPSILSLAFPGENPSLNRTAGAIVPVFLLVAFGLESMLSSLKERMGISLGTRLAWITGLALFAWAALLNYDMVFKQYQSVYENSAWNTSEVGEVVREFSDTIGTPDTAWVVAYPHWVDSRLVMLNAGYPGRDNALLPERIPDTLADPRPKLFLLNPQDAASLQTLMTLYPQGWLQLYPAKVETKQFLMFFVPPPGIGY